MSLHAVRRAGGFAVLVLLGAAVWVLAQGEQVLTDFRYPVKDKDGRVKADLIARAFRIPTNGLVRVEGLEWRVRAGEGTIPMVVTSDRCRFNRESNVIASDASIRIERGDTVMTGTGYICDLTGSSFTLLNDARVELRGVSLWRKKTDVTPQP